MRRVAPLLRGSQPSCRRRPLATCAHKSRAPRPLALFESTGPRSAVMTLVSHREIRRTMLSFADSSESVAEAAKRPRGEVGSAATPNVFVAARRRRLESVSHQGLGPRRAEAGLDARHGTGGRRGHGAPRDVASKE